MSIQRNARFCSRSLMMCGLLFASLAAPFLYWPSGTVNAKEVGPTGKITSSNSAAIEAMMEPEIQRLVDGQSRLPGQGRLILVNIIADPNNESITINVDKSFIPQGKRHLTEDLGDLISEIIGAASSIVGNTFGPTPINFTVGGKDLSEIFPDDFSPRKRSGNKASFVKPSAVSGLVIVNPGHGFYYHYGTTNDWIKQRPLYPGSSTETEDSVMPGYSTELSDLMIDRSYEYVTAIANTRDVLNSAVDPDSGKPWKDLGSRYFLRRQYPTLGPTLWNMFPNGTEPDRLALREYDEDIRSRPEYANLLDAETMISIHSNGSTNVNARGFEVYTRLTDPESVKLATNISCAAKELIQSNPTFSSFPVDLNPRSSVHGEVNRADATAVLIEVGYHSNATDAAALLDPTFRTAAMKGAEKGYRLTKEGKDCVPFAITDIPDVSGPSDGSEIPANIEFAGFPQFPVIRMMENVSCPANATCPDATSFYYEKIPSPLPASFKCTGFTTTQVGTFSTTLIDADGVKTEPIEHTLTCTPNSAAAAKGRTSVGKIEGN